MNIGIIGLGLIGGSFGKALVKKTDHKVFGFDVSAEVMNKAVTAKAITAPLTKEYYKELDVVIFALNSGIFFKEVYAYAPLLKDGAILIDIAGNKKEVVNVMQNVSKSFPRLNFVSTHPMAGNEYSGIEYSKSTLFERASILTIPVCVTNEAKEKLYGLLTDAGFGFICETTAEEHDAVIAYTSQLPHVISSCFVDNPLAKKHHGFSAGSFADMSRVSRMNSKMWTELLMDNRENVLKNLDIFIENLNNIKTYLSQSDRNSLESSLEKVSNIKSEVDEQNREWKKSRSKKKN